MTACGRFGGFRHAMLASLCVFAPWAPADAQSRAGDPCLVAQIVSLSGVESRGGITILTPARAGPPREREARLRECLRPGEQIRVIAPEPARAVVRMRGEVRTLTARTPPLTIPAQREPGFWDGFATFVRSFRIFSSTPEVAVAETYARRSLAEVREHPLLVPGEQFLPAGQDSLTIMWIGPDAPVELDNASKRIVASLWNTSGNRVVFESLALNGRYDLQVSDRLHYAVVTVDPGQIPEPGWMQGRASASDEERVARALWILTDGPPPWRLFALNELRRLRATSFAAERIWEWIGATDDLGRMAPR
jgi:hypothetical protein